MYCYVHCNPITKFDPFGLKVSSETKKDDEGNYHTTFKIDAQVVFDEELGLKKKKAIQEGYLEEIKAGITDTFTSNDDVDKAHTWSIEVNITIASSAKDVKKNNHIIFVTKTGSPNANRRLGKSLGVVSPTRNRADLSLTAIQGCKKTDLGDTAGHEVGHLFGLGEGNITFTRQLKIEANSDGTYGDAMVQTSGYSWLNYENGDRISDEFKLGQVKQMNRNYKKEGANYTELNRALPKGSPPSIWDKFRR